MQNKLPTVKIPQHNNWVLLQSYIKSNITYHNMNITPTSYSPFALKWCSIIKSLFISFSEFKTPSRSIQNQHCSKLLKILLTQRTHFLRIEQVKGFCFLLTGSMELFEVAKCSSSLPVNIFVFFWFSYFSRSFR